jgi:hypothetical protein
VGAGVEDLRAVLCEPGAAQRAVELPLRVDLGVSDDPGWPLQHGVNRGVRLRQRSRVADFRGDSSVRRRLDVLPLVYARQNGGPRSRYAIARKT